MQNMYLEALDKLGVLLAGNTSPVKAPTAHFEMELCLKTTQASFHTNKNDSQAFYVPYAFGWEFTMCIVSM